MVYSMSFILHVATCTLCLTQIMSRLTQEKTAFPRFEKDTKDIAYHSMASSL